MRARQHLCYDAGQNHERQRMIAMTDPSLALAAFQADVSAGRVPLERSALDPGVLTAMDAPGGRMRCIYLTMEGKVITALAIMAMVGIRNREPTFQLGIAVAEDYRRQGRAKKLLAAALNELRHGSAHSNVPVIHVEAVVSQDNTASNALMPIIFDETPRPITDSVSGEPALYYRQRFALTG